MKINKLKVLSLTLVFLLLLVPAALAQETDSFDDIDFGEYDLGELTDEQIESLKAELRELYDSADEIDKEAIRTALENLDIEEIEDFEVDSLGQELSAAIEEFKNKTDEDGEKDWTGQELSGFIQDFLDERIENRKNRDENEVEVQNQKQNNNKNEVAQENKNSKNEDKNKSNKGKSKGK